MDGIFDIKDFIIRILRKWRSILILAVVFGLLFGCGKYALTLLSIKSETTNPDVEMKKWKEDIKDIENSIDILQNGIYTWDDYYSNSRLMKIDSYHAESYSIVSLIQSKSEAAMKSEAAGVALTYAKLSETGAYLDEVAEKSGLDKDIVQELVRVTAESGTLVIKGYTSEDIRTDAAVEAIYEIIESDFQNRYSDEYSMEELSSGFYTGKDEDLISLQDRYIANGERYISEKSSRQRVLDVMETESPVENATYESAKVDAVKFGVVGCVFGVILAVIFGLLKDFMSKKLYSEREIQKEWNLSCIAGERILNNRKRSFIDKKIDGLYTGEQLQLTENEWVDYVTARILQLSDADENVYLTGSIVKDNTDTRISALVQELKDKGIAVGCGKNVINSAVTVEQLKDYQNVILMESAGKSDWALIEEEIELLRSMNKNIVGFIMV